MSAPGFSGGNEINYGWNSGTRTWKLNLEDRRNIKQDAVIGGNLEANAVFRFMSIQTLLRPVCLMCVCKRSQSPVESTLMSLMDGTNSRLPGGPFPVVKAVPLPAVISPMQLKTLLTMSWETTRSGRLEVFGSGFFGIRRYWVFLLVETWGVARQAKVHIESITVFLRCVYVCVCERVCARVCTCVCTFRKAV